VQVSSTTRHDWNALCRALEARWHREIPISAAMGITIGGFDGTRLDLHAALSPNVNVHGTAFAGSLFSLASLCGWGLVHLQMQRRDLAGAIVFAEGHIRCLKPVHDDVRASCVWSEAEDAALNDLAASGKARFRLLTRLHCGEDVVAEFSGEYAVRLPRQ
jgi:thioesterase domain-containing protein